MSGVVLESARFAFYPAFNLDLRQHENWLWFDDRLKMWRRRRMAAVLFFGRIVEQPPRKIAHLIGQGYVVVKPKAHFNRVSAAAVGAGHHDIILPVDDAAAKLHFAVGPNFNVHTESLSDDVTSPSFETGAGGASSPARKGGGGRPTAYRGAFPMRSGVTCADFDSDGRMIAGVGA